MPVKKADSFTERSGKSYAGGWDSNFSTVGSRVSGNSSGFNSTALPFVNPTPAKSAGTVDLKPGDNVVHKKFGVGTITSVEKDNDDYRLEIQFRNSGMKRLMAAYANLTKL